MRAGFTTTKTFRVSMLFFGRTGRNEWVEVWISILFPSLFFAQKVLSTVALHGKSNNRKHYWNSRDPFKNFVPPPKYLSSSISFFSKLLFSLSFSLSLFLFVVRYARILLHTNGDEREKTSDSFRQRGNVICKKCTKIVETSWISLLLLKYLCFEVTTIRK